ncbi:MAG: hypothetical protein K2Q34_07670 [Alphaproteobacteria bacterium]|nr:hypothetical protein [Alphaproteobacteria bacterium]
MKTQIASKITMGCLVAFLSIEAQAAEALLGGLKRAVPVAKWLRASFIKADPDALLKGLENATPKARRILSNCTTRLPEDLLSIKEPANNLSGGVLQLEDMVKRVAQERRADFILTFPGSSLDRNMRNALDELRAVANKDSRVLELDAYKNAELICEDLALDPPPLR